MHFQRKFVFRPGFTIVALIAFVALAALGSWQLKRLEWKQSLIEKVETRTHQPPAPFAEIYARAQSGEDVEYAPVFVEGEYSQTGAASLFGSYNGAPGYYDFTPLRMGGGELVYINRGFMPLNLSGEELEAASISSDSQARVTGYFRYAQTAQGPSAWLGLNNQSEDGYWFVRNPNAFGAAAGISVLPFYIDSFAVDGRQWPKGGVTRLEFSNRHLEYALTWFGMGAALVGVWIAFSLQKLE